MRHVHNLKNNVFVISGQVKGKTLLPLPVGSDKIRDSYNNEERYKLLNLESIFSLIFKLKQIYNFIQAVRGLQLGFTFLVNIIFLAFFSF